MTKVETYLFSVRFTFVNIRQVKGPLVGHMPDKTHSPGNFRLSILFSLFCGVSDFGPSVITLSGVPLILPIRNVSAVFIKRHFPVRHILEQAPLLAIMVRVAPHFSARLVR